MIRLLKIAFLLVFLHIFQSTVLYRAGFLFQFIDLTLLLVAWVAMRRDTWKAVLAGMIIGYFQYLFWSGPIALGVVAFGSAAWFVSAAHRRLVGESFGGLLLILTGMVIVHDLVLLAGQISGGFIPFAARLILFSLPTAILTALIGTAIYEGVRYLKRSPAEAV